MTTIAEIFVPVKTKNELNSSHGHWAAKSARRKEVRNAVTRCLYEHDWEGYQQRPTADSPYKVTLTRVTPYSPRMDDDGLASSLKSVRDACAEFLGVDDKERHIVRYRYEQEKGSEYGVRIRIDPRQIELTLNNH